MTSERTQDWVDEFGQSVIRRAARHAPGVLSERVEEEWLADLAQRRGPISRLTFAMGCCWAARVIAYDHRIAVAHLAGSAAGFGNYLGFASNGTPMVSRRTMTFLLVACLHAAALYALLVSVTSQFHKAITPPLQARTIDFHPPIDVPSTPQPVVSSFPLDPRKPNEMPKIDTAPVDLEPRALEGPHDPMMPPSPPAAVNRVQGGPGRGFPSTDDFYPSIAIFKGERGIATIRACVDVAGRLTSLPIVTESSGSSRLDDGALRLAKAGSGHYQPTTENGQPVNSCYAFRIRFELRN